MSKSVALYKKVCYYIIAKGRKETQIMKKVKITLRSKITAHERTYYCHHFIIDPNLIHICGVKGFKDFTVLEFARNEWERV